jgi:hypothetical protein
VLKRIRFATWAGVTGHDWRAAVAAALDGPVAVRPVRVAVCTVLSDMTPNPRHDGIGLEWFRDSEHLARFEAWLAAADGTVVERQLGRVLDVDASPVLVADEHVMRGGDWLEQRWRDGGAAFKHMAIARRAEGLTQAQFQDRWRSRAGKVGAVLIPDGARGLAYVQNHPVPRSDGVWAYDALNEVWFDDLDGLRRRIAWFAEVLGDGTEDDLVGESWFVAAREEILAPP